MQKESCLVSIIIPSLNEEKFIGKCLDSIIANDFPKDRLEVLVVDGMSEDKTRAIVEKYCEKYPFIQLIDNTRKIIPCALNIGIKQAKGEIIIRMDAHSEYFCDYIKETVLCLKNTGADNVGGVRITSPSKNTYIAKLISLVTSSPFGVGRSKYRFSKKGSFVDTVPNGAFKKELFNKIGYFDERLVRNQDNEFNARIIKQGGRIFVSPLIRSYYYNQSRVCGLLRQAFKTGMWNLLTISINPTAFRWRHFIPFIFVAVFFVTSIFAFLQPWAKIAFLILITLYSSAAIISSFLICFREGIKYFYFLPIIFFLYHFCYGLGTSFGIIKFVLTIGRRTFDMATKN